MLKDYYLWRVEIHRVIVYDEEVTEGDDNYNLSKKHDPKSKAKLARPFKPAIYLE